jgi:hypothetical protein
LEAVASTADQNSDPIQSKRESSGSEQDRTEAADRVPKVANVFQENEQIMPRIISLLELTLVFGRERNPDHCCPKDKHSRIRA